MVIGAVGIDTNIYLQGRKIDFSVEANFTENIDYVGQAGGYQCRNFTQLGYKTAFIGYIGNDFLGNMIRNEFSKDGIDISGLFIDPQGTKRSINIVYKDGKRKNFYDGKSHMSLSPNLDICRSILRKTKHVHFNIMNWSRNLLQISKELGLTISCDIQDIVNPNDPYRNDFINYADILFFSSTNIHDPSPIFKTYREQRPESLIIAGMGEKGCAYCKENDIRFYPKVDIPNLPIVDTNGAGDSLSVGFLTSYIFDGFSIEDSILRGQINARFTCSIKGSTSSFLTKDLLNNYFYEFKVLNQE